jgi:hypothetical protein
MGQEYLALMVSMVTLLSLADGTVETKVYTSKVDALSATFGLH